MILGSPPRCTRIGELKPHFCWERGRLVRNERAQRAKMSFRSNSAPVGALRTGMSALPADSFASTDTCSTQRLIALATSGAPVYTRIGAATHTTCDSTHKIMTGRNG